MTEQPHLHEHKSLIDKAWREGVDYFKVENSIGEIGNLSFPAAVFNQFLPL